MLKHTLYLGYPLPALLYDARKGDPLSAYAVYSYFVASVERGAVPDPDVMRFVAREMKAVLDGDQSADAMIHKNGAKRYTDTLRAWDHVAVMRDAYANLPETYEAVGRLLHMAPATVKKHYKTEQARQKRLRQVQSLLDAMASNTDHATHLDIIQQLRKLYP